MFKDVFIVTSAFFRENASEINRENKLQTTKLALNGSFIAAVLFLVSIVFEPLKVNQPAYLGIFLYSLLLYCITWFLQNKDGVILPIFYLYITGCFAFATYLAVFCTKVHSGVTFCVFLVLLPTFVIDRQLRMYLYLLFVTLVYIGVEFLRGGAEYNIMCAVDSLSFMGISMIAYSYNLSLHIKDVESRQILTKKVETDALTQLFNRSALEKNIMSYIQESDEEAAFILVDVDNFKGINDNFGHMTGDELLYQTAAILKEQFRRTDYIGRLGGDEFVIFLPRVSDGQWLVNKMSTLVAEMDRTFIGDKAICNVSGSVGIAMYPEHGRSFDELYRKADMAMYRSKASGKNQFTIYVENG